MRNKTYITEFYKVGYGGSVRAYNKIWTAWPWRQWVKVWHYWDYMNEGRM